VEPQEKVKDDILNRKDVLELVQSGSHCKIFVEGENCNFHECKMVQFKNPKASSSKRTKLADRMIGKSNKFSCYVSAFGNYNGGHRHAGPSLDAIIGVCIFIYSCLQRKNNRFQKKSVGLNTNI
jgi:hypothetical protein